MKKILLAIFASMLAGTAAYSQDTTSDNKPTQPKTITISEAKNKPSAPAKVEKKRTVFRPTKDQIKQAQALLKGKSLYKGEETGEYDADTRAAIRSFQKDNGLNSTGGLNRATLEKMNIPLTESQKAIPVSEGSYASDEPAKPAKTDSGPSASTEPKPKKPAIFRATKDQIIEAQKIVKTEQTGKLDDATREGLKKYQGENGLKATGTLNRLTLEKMGIGLTEQQKAMSADQ